MSNTVQGVKASLDRPARELLIQLAAHYHISRSAVVRRALYRLAASEDLTPSPTLANFLAQHRPDSPLSSR